MTLKQKPRLVSSWPKLSATTQQALMQTIQGRIVVSDRKSHTFCAAVSDQGGRKEVVDEAAATSLRPKFPERVSDQSLSGHKWLQSARKQKLVL